MRTVKSTLIGIAAASVMIAVSLSGCAADTNSGDGSPTLLETKQAAQLLRNQVSGQLSAGSTESISKVRDASEACDGDAEGLHRLWRSTTQTELTPEHASEVNEIVQNISGKFVSKGWNTSTKELSDSSVLVTLENDNSLAVIEITAAEDADGDGDGATIFVDVTGPCVLTDGPGSDELAVLGE